jgi:CheY-like chemotaxis protein
MPGFKDPAGLSPHRARVLVVDDHRDSANAIVRLLRAEGYEAEAAYGYAETLDACKVGHFDVLVTDVRLRDGDGVQMLDAMRDRCAAPHAIAVSGSDEADEIARARLAGFSDYLVKPFPVTALLAAIARADAAGAGN